MEGKRDSVHHSFNPPQRVGGCLYTTGFLAVLKSGLVFFFFIAPFYILFSSSWEEMKSPLVSVSNHLKFGKNKEGWGLLSTAGLR